MVAVKIEGVFEQISARLEEIATQVRIRGDILDAVELAERVFEALLKEGKEVFAGSKGEIDLAELRIGRDRALLVLAGDGTIYVIAGIRGPSAGQVTATVASMAPDATALSNPIEDRMGRMLPLGHSVYLRPLGVDTAFLLRCVVWGKPEPKRRR